MGPIRRMLFRKLSMAWEKWQLTAAEMAKQQALLNQAMQRFLGSKMYAAWNQWRSWAVVMRRPQHMMSGALRRMLAVGCTDTQSEDLPCIGCGREPKVQSVVQWLATLGCSRQSQGVTCESSSAGELHLEAATGTEWCIVGGSSCCHL